MTHSLWCWHYRCQKPPPGTRQLLGDDRRVHHWMMPTFILGSKNVPMKPLINRLVSFIFFTYRSGWQTQPWCLCRQGCLGAGWIVYLAGIWQPEESGGWLSCRLHREREHMREIMGICITGGNEQTDLSRSPFQRLCWYLPWLVLLMKSDDGSLTGSGGKSIMNENESRYRQSHIKPLKLLKSPNTSCLICAQIIITLYFTFKMIPKNVLLKKCSDFTHKHVIRHIL